MNENSEYEVIAWWSPIKFELGPWRAMVQMQGHLPDKPTGYAVGKSKPEAIKNAWQNYWCVCREVGDNA